MKFKYIGECAAGFVSLGGIEFPKGKSVEVNGEALIAKLQGNSHFEEVKPKKKD